MSGQINVQKCDDSTVWYDFRYEDAIFNSNSNSNEGYAIGWTTGGAHGALGASTHISNMGADLTHIISSGIKFNTYYIPAIKSQPDIYMERACNHSIYLD